MSNGFCCWQNEKPWLHPLPKDEAACQVEDEEGHEGYRHKEVRIVSPSITYRCMLHCYIFQINDTFSQGCLGKVTNWLQFESFTLVFVGMAMAGIQVNPFISF